MTLVNIQDFKRPRGANAPPPFPKKVGFMIKDGASQVTSGKEPPAPSQSSRSKSNWFDPWARKIPLEEGTVTYSNTLAWRIPGTEKPDGL